MGTRPGGRQSGRRALPHSWSSAGTYSVRAQARCATHTYTSSLSGALSVVITTNEVISTPSTPSGPTSGSPGTTYSYSGTGASSNLGHTVQEVFFELGDGNTSGWLPVGTTSASHSWSSAGTYSVRAQARCATQLLLPQAPRVRFLW